MLWLMYIVHSFSKSIVNLFSSSATVNPMFVTNLILSHLYPYPFLYFCVTILFIKALKTNDSNLTVKLHVKKVSRLTGVIPYCKL